jgi:hypothetical protein
MCINKVKQAPLCTNTPFFTKTIFRTLTQHNPNSTPHQPIIARQSSSTKMGSAAADNEKGEILSGYVEKKNRLGSWNKRYFVLLQGDFFLVSSKHAIMFP